MPSTSGYDPNVFESCEGEDAPFQGVYDGYVFKQGDANTPDAHPPAPSSNCQAIQTLSHGLLRASTSSSSSSASTSSTPTNASSLTTSTTSASATNGSQTGTQAGQATTTPGSAAASTSSQQGSSGASTQSTVPLSILAALVLGAFML